MFKRFFQAEEGSVTVFVAVAMTVLLGFSALAVDYGSLTNERSLLQNAADAAALAGVVKVKTKPDEAKADAKEYVLKNTTGVLPEDIVVTPVADTLQVNIKKDCQAFFSQVLTGDTTNQVATSATAQYAGEIQKPEYAIWAENEIELKNKSEIVGKIHSNTIINDEGDGNFDFKGNFEVPDEQKTAGGEVMPDYSYLMDGAVEFDRSKLADPNKIDIGDISKFDENLIYIIKDGQDITITKKVILTISLITNGRIIFNGNGTNVNAKVLYSTYDSEANGGHPAIVINGSGGTLKALVYAPNGDVVWNGGKTKLQGAIIAQNFLEDGASPEITYDDTVTNKYPRLVPHLIK